MRENLINRNSIEIKTFPRNDSLVIENQIQQFMIDHEGEMIVNDIMLLEDMGYEKKMINKIYILLQPENMERAIDFMTEIDGKYQHNFFESSKDKNLCFICKRSKRYHMDYIQNENDQNKIEEDDLLIDDNKDRASLSIKIDGINNTCNVCYEDIESEDIKFNYLPCGHICCTQCWYSYLKSLISEAKVEKIKCVEYKCQEEIPEDFILKHINNDSKLLEKYNKFKFRASIFKDPNKKQCPEPGCESYLEKDINQKYVKCKEGHEYCFNCLGKPHGITSCDEFMEKEFMDWKKYKRVKRCPRCKIYTEKNEGCNHMTCSSCKYQWCWLCEQQYTYSHYENGKCRGFQFTKADNVEEAENIERPNQNLINRNGNANRNRNNACCFCLHNIFPCSFEEPIENNIDSFSEKILYIFLMWIIGFLGFVYYSFFDSPCFNYVNKTGILFAFVILIGFTLFISFQIFFSCLITPFILICFISPNFINKIFKFLCMRVH